VDRHRNAAGRESWWSIGQFAGQLIDQFPMAVVVVNCPPFKGALTACHPHRVIHCRHADAVKRQWWSPALPASQQGNKVSPPCPSPPPAHEALHAIAVLASHLETCALRPVIGRAFNNVYQMHL